MKLALLLFVQGKVWRNRPKFSLKNRPPMIKDQKLKVQASIVDKQVRVTGKKIDDLQEVIQLLKKADLDVPLQFVNMKS